MLTHIARILSSACAIAAHLTARGAAPRGHARLRGGITTVGQPIANWGNWGCALAKRWLIMPGVNLTLRSAEAPLASR